MLSVLCDTEFIGRNDFLLACQQAQMTAKGILSYETSKDHFTLNIDSNNTALQVWLSLSTKPESAVLISYMVSAPEISLEEFDLLLESVEESFPIFMGAIYRIIHEIEPALFIEVLRPNHGPDTTATMI